MNISYVVLGSAVVLGVAYWLYGGLLTRMFALKKDAVTPAVELRDDVDYIPIAPKFLMGQHFSAIAAAGPVVGPIVAGVMFGWAPALLWIIVGSIFIGGVHDMSTLVASVRHKARSVTELVREHFNRRAYLIFLVFIWLTLVYIIVAFTDITASSFTGMVALENGAKVSGGAVASSSLMYLALPIFMGLLMRYAKLSLGWATVIFLPLVGVAIWAGKFAPVSMEALLLRWEPDPVRAQALAVKVWDVLILAYCFAAALVPVWLLLQPRGHLGGFFLYAALFGGGAGLVLRGAAVKYPAIVSVNTGTMYPMMFIMIACGACSGFHALVSSGTSSKQLARETDARVIGYGAMLLEALVAVVSLSFVMMLAAGDPLTQKPPNFIYASGLGGFLGVFGIPATFGVTFGLLAFTTFVYDTLDVCTRLGRYIIEELTGWKGWFGRGMANVLTAGAPLFFVMRTMTDAQGKPVPAWKYFWTLFGASNQLMASLALLCVTVWLARTSRFRWAAWVTGLPMAFMYVTTMNALVRIISGYFFKPEGFAWTADPVPWIAIVLVVLAAIMLVEAAAALLKPAAPSGGAPVPAQA